MAVCCNIRCYKYHFLNQENSSCQMSPSRTPPHARTLALPDELLLEIFKINAAYDVDEPRAHIEDTIAFSQVCRQWRHVSLASSALWARCLDYCLGQDWIKEILRRSGKQLLRNVYPTDLRVFKRCRSLSLILNSAGWREHCSFLATHLVRIKHITLGCVDPLWSFSSADFENTALWCAQTLHLRNLSLPLHSPMPARCAPESGHA